MKKKTLTFFSVYFTFFVDTLSWAIVFPIFAPYFLDPKNVLFSPEVSDATRSAIFGLFLAAFSLGQFLGAPVMGEYADRHGRKSALRLGVFFTFCGLLLSAWSMRTNQLVFLCLSRFVTGIFASSTSVCLSSISDLSESEKSKLKNFGYLSMAAGLAFVIGAYFGGQLSDRMIYSAFSASFPLWIAAGITFLNLLFVWWGFEETSHVHPEARFDLFKSFTYAKEALRTGKIKKVYLIYFLFLISWTILFQFSTVLAVQKFQFTTSNIGNMAVLLGVCWAVGSGYLNRHLVHHFKSMHILEASLLGFTLFCSLITFPHHASWVVSILSACVVLGAVAWPICNGLISNAVPANMQGKILGMSQAVQSLAMTLAPSIGGLAFHVSLGFPFFIASASCFFAVVIYYYTLKNE